MRNLVLAIAATAGATSILFLLLRRHRKAAGPVAHVENGFEFTVHAPLRRAAVLFGGSGERAWGGGRWNPRFLYPQPERDQPGEVFTVAHGHVRSTWVNTAFDLDAGHLQYVYVVPDVQAAIIDVHLAPKDESSTSVRVLYRRTALDPAQNDHVTELGRHDRDSGKQWEAAIEEHLRSGVLAAP